MAWISTSRRWRCLKRAALLLLLLLAVTRFTGSLWLAGAAPEPVSRATRFRRSLDGQSSEATSQPPWKEQEDSPEDSPEMETMADRAMEGVRSGAARRERQLEEQIRQEWEAQMREQVDDYLRSVAAGEVPPEQLGHGPEDHQGRAANSRRLAERAAEERRKATEQQQAAQSTDSSSAAPEETEVPEEANLHGEGPSEEERALHEAEDLLFVNVSQRDVSKAVSLLSDLTAELETLIPQTPTLRRKYQVGSGSGHPPQDDGLPYSPRRPPFSDSLHKALAQAHERASDSIAMGGLLDPELSAEGHRGAAAYMLAALTASGLAAPGLPLDDAIAVRILHISAMTGSLEAHAALADRYFTGRGVPESCWWGLQHIKVVADHAIQVTESTGNYVQPLPTVRFRDRWMDANYIDAHELENGAAQVEMEEDMASRGSSEAQRHLGWRRLLGHGMEANPEDAMREFQGAAVDGDLYAMFNLGYMHLRGHGAAQDFGAAREWFGRAAEAGLPAAYNGLGVMAFHGQGRKQNLTEARLAFENGANSGDADSMFNLGSMYRTGYGVEEDVVMAKKYFEDAYDAGHWRAGHSLAAIAEANVGGPPNCTRAAELMQVFIAERFGWVDGLIEAQRDFDGGDHWGAAVRLALLAEQGCEQAEANLAFVLQRGELDLPERHRTAMRMLLRSGDRGGADSLVEAGNTVLKGASRGLAKGDNATMALDLYRRSAEAGEVEAMFLVGWMFAHGVGAEQNSTEAAHWYWKAIERTPQPQPAMAPALALLELMARDVWRGVLWAFSVGPSSRDVRNAHSSQTGTGTARWRRVDQDWDSALLAVLVVALSLVLWIRWRRVSSLQQTRQQHLEDSAANAHQARDVRPNSPAGASARAFSQAEEAISPDENRDVEDAPEDAADSDGAYEPMDSQPAQPPGPVERDHRSDTE